MAASTPSPLAFVSHASEDKDDFVLPLATELRALGIDAWVDVWEIKPGDSLVTKIFNEGLARADVFVVVVSHASAAKPWVRDELDAATIRRISDGTRLVPVLLNEAEPPEAVKHLAWISSAGTPEGAKQVAGRIADVLYGHDVKPPLGPAPGYLEAPSFPGLSRQDSVVLLEITRHALEQGNLIALNWREVAPRVTEQDVSVEAARESLDALEQNYLIKFDARGDSVIRLALTTHGFRTAITSLVPDLEDINGRLIARLVNDPPASNRVIHDLADELAVPPLVIEQLLVLLEEAAQISFSKTLGQGSRLHAVSPTLKRLLK